MTGKTPPPGKPNLTGAGSKALMAAIKKLSKQIDEANSQIKIPEFGIFGAMDIDIQRLKTMEEAMMRLGRAGAPFAKGGALDRAAQNIGETFDKLVGNAEVGVRAVNGLFSAMEQFGQMAEIDDLAQITTQFAEQAAAFDKFGLSFSQYAQQVELGQNMLNMTKDSILALNQGLMDFSSEMRMMPSVVSRNFQLVAKSLSYDAPKIVEQFKEIQKMSSMTGVSVGTMMGGMGERLDSLPGAASFVGQLNAILGRNVFSPNQIMMMDEADRIVKIREAIQQHPIMGEINKGSKLGKFALRTISKVVNFSREDTRKYLTGELSDAELTEEGQARRKAGKLSLKEQAARAIAGDKGDGGLFAEASARLTKQMIQNGLSEDKRVEALGRYTTAIQNLYLSEQDLLRAKERGRFVNVFDQKNRDQDRVDQAIQQGGLKLLKDFGEDGELKTILGTSGEEFTELGGAPQIVRAMSRAPQLRRLLTILQTLPNNKASRGLRRQVRGFIQKAGRTSRMDQTARTRARKDLEGLFDIYKTEIQPFRESDDEISQLEMAGIELVRRAAGDNLGLVRRMERFAREGDRSVEDMKQEAKRLNIPESTATADPKKAQTDLEKSFEILRDTTRKPGNTEKSTGDTEEPNPADGTGFNLDPKTIEAVFAGLQGFFKTLSLELPMEDGTVTAMVGATLKRNGIG